MKVFISFSGEMSRDIALIFSKWLPKVLQFVKPYYSEDMDKGIKWFNDIINGLKDSKIGIIILTPDNLNSKWIMFEAGAISNAVGKSLVCPILFKIKKSDISGPLSHFQISEFNNQEIRKLIKTINNLGGELKLEDNIREETFDNWWQKGLKDKVDQILQDPKYSEVDKKIERSERDILEEILELTRSFSRGRSIDMEKISKSIPSLDDIFQK